MFFCNNRLNGLPSSAAVCSLCSINQCLSQGRRLFPDHFASKFFSLLTTLRVDTWGNKGCIEKGCGSVVIVWLFPPRRPRHFQGKHNARLEATDRLLPTTYFHFLIAAVSRLSYCCAFIRQISVKSIIKINKNDLNRFFGTFEISRRIKDQNKLNKYNLVFLIQDI